MKGCQRFPLFRPRSPLNSGMTDSRFFQPKGPFSLREISIATKTSLNDLSDGDKSIRDVGPLGQAKGDELSFLDNPKYIPQFKETDAGAVIVHPDRIEHRPSGIPLLISENPYTSYALAAQMFHPLASVTFPGISTNADIDKSACLGRNCQVESGVVIESQVEVGENCFLGANSVIGKGVVIGANSFVGPGVTISHSRIGEGVMIHSGARIGQPGFGFSMDSSGHVLVPQVGLVLIEDGCRIGANTTIDRGAGGNTIIGAGCMIDNLVQIGHNAHIGDGCVIVAQSGIAGSTTLGKYVVLGGQVGIAGHLSIGDGAMVAAKSGITKNIVAGEKYGGIPGVPIQQWKRQVGALARLVKRVRKGG